MTLNYTHGQQTSLIDVNEIANFCKISLDPLQNLKYINWTENSEIKSFKSSTVFSFD